MRYRFFGDTGIRVSEIALGTQTFGWGAGEEEAFAIADRYAEAGGNFFDTADIYNGGVAESMLGAWLKARGERGSRIVATKVFFPTGEGANDAGLSRKHIFDSVDGSLRRLQTDFIDLYQAHCFDRCTPLAETLRALDDLVRAGKVRYLGASNFTASQLQKALDWSRMNGWASFCSLQAEYSLIVRSTEWELIPLCRDERLGMLAWSPLAGGWLTGKYHGDRPPPADSRVGRKDRWDDQPEQRDSALTRQVVETLLQIARERGRTPAQVALNWLLEQEEAVFPLIGARTREQLEENLGSTGWSLSEEEKARLDRSSATLLPYPYRFIERYTRRRE